MENLTLDVLDPGMLPYYRQYGNNRITSVLPTILSELEPKTLDERIGMFSSIDVPYPVPLSRILLSGTHHGRTVSVRAVSTHITFPT
jgi:hypothetical protein